MPASLLWSSAKGRSFIPLTPLSTISEKSSSMTSSTADEDDSSITSPPNDDDQPYYSSSSITSPPAHHFNSNNHHSSSSLLRTPMSPTSSSTFSPHPVVNGGLYYRHPHHYATKLSDLRPTKRALQLSPNMSPSIRSSPSVSPQQRRKQKRRKRVAFFLSCLLTVSMCASITLTFYLMHQQQGKYNDSNENLEGRPYVWKHPYKQQQKQEKDGLWHYHVSNTKNDNLVIAEAAAAAVKKSLASSSRNNVGEADARQKQSQRNSYNQATSPFIKPRIVVLESSNPSVFKSRILQDDYMLHAPFGQEAAPQDDFVVEPDPNDDCVPMSDWQTKSFPNCNSIHELNLIAAGGNVGSATAKNVSHEDKLMILGQGWFRHTWQLDVGASNETVVLKTLRLEREFYGEFFELHRRDAVAMERLTFSPFVMDIYGFCGQSAINEMASFGHGDVTNLEKFDRRLRGKDTPQATFVKLQIATSVAVGVAHVHQVNGAEARPSMVHYDLNPRNIAIVKGGKPKLNDFNIAEFLRINRKTNETCPFPSRLHEPWWRAPEEVVLPKPGEVRYIDEKADVFSLGNLLYHVLTTRSPRGKLDKRKRMETVRAQVARGEPPPLHKFYIHTKDPSVIAFKKAMKMCFHMDPKKRASATQVADVLLDALIEIRAKNPNIGKIHRAAATTTTREQHHHHH